MLGLGGSVATPPEGVTAEVMVVESFEELEGRAAEARGRIVLFDVPYEGYGKTVRYRVGAASAAARTGARAALIRSIASGSMQNPHTGGMRYTDDAPRIPAAALSIEHAGLLHRLVNRGETVTVRLLMEAETLPDVPSRNIVAEVPGTHEPDEIVVLGGHIDSWDVGQGAMDDAGGLMAAWEALSLLVRLNLRPRRTLRLVGWTNEENGLRGGLGYRDAHRDELSRHVIAMESDSGFFRPTRMRFGGDARSMPVVEAIAALLASGGPFDAAPGGPAADVGPLYREGVPTLSLSAEPTKYFYYHHSAADAPEVLDPGELAHGVAVLATFAYVLGDIPVRLAGPEPAKD